MPRDNFSERTKTLLRNRVNGRCSMPECRVSTLGAATDPAAIASIGFAAHIHAAAPGGPRYLETMTPGQRRAAGNGIWLCGTHARLIDSDEERYSADMLRQWKETAESRAREEIGKRLPSDREAQDQLVMALTRMPTSFLPTAIQNVHGATAEVLNGLDKRFRVETAFANDRLMYRFIAQEPVEIRFAVGEQSAAEWRRQVMALVKHGETARVPGLDVRVHGSLIFDKAFTPEVLSEGKFIFTPSGRPAVAKVSLVDPSSQSVFAIDDFHGLVTHGTQSFTFAGKSCADLLSISLRIPLSVTLQSEGDFTIALGFDQWVGKAVMTLPFFERLRDFYQKINDGWVVDVQLEVDGNRVIGAHMQVPQDNSVFRSTHVMLEYTHRVRQLTSKLGKRVNFQLEPPFSAEDHMRLAEMVEILIGEDSLTAETVDSMTCSLVADHGGDNVRKLKAESVSHKLVFRNDHLEPLVLFGEQVALPKLLTTMENVVPWIEADVHEVKEGDSVVVVWKPTTGFKFSRCFDLGGPESKLWPPSA